MSEVNGLKEESVSKIKDLLNQMKKELQGVVLRGLGLAVAGVFPIAVLAVSLELEKTMFPMIAGLATGLLIHFSYLVPRGKEVAMKYDQKVREVIENDKRD